MNFVFSFVDGYKILLNKECDPQFLLLVLLKPHVKALIFVKCNVKM